MKSLLFSFQGRINRAPYWYVHLALLVIQAPIFFILADTIITPAMQTKDFDAIQKAFNTMNILSLVFIPFYWISLAIMAKRCHDRDKSGWFIFVMLVPLIGPLWLMIELGFLRGTYGPNRYGADPLGFGGPAG